jgi:PKD repeat protein
MKKTIYTLNLLFLSFSGLFAQESLFSSYPSGYRYSQDVSNLRVESIAGPSTETIQSIVNGEHPKSGEMYIIGQNMPVNLTPQNSGEWKTYDGFKTWRLKIKSPGAEGIALLYSKFRIPNTASVFVYNNEMTHKSRAYKNHENPTGEHFSTEIITSDEIILEYWAPLTETAEPIIEIEAVSHVFRGGNHFRPKNWQQNGSSDACEVNVNCSEGNTWQDQKRGVAKIYVIDGSSGGLCTGSLINNTAQDCKNYFLTAQHCGAGASASNFNQWQFYFNFESPNCADLTNTQANNEDNEVVTGCTKRATGSDVSTVSNSDFLLVEFNNAIPSSYNVYYNGWDRNNTGASSGVGIHHPSGDIKKISTFTTTLQNDSWSGTTPGTHWRVVWAGTANGHGVTEQGSSGSPIFNQAKRIVGDLSGGSSFCTATSAPDLYGKISYSWQTVGTANNRRLSPWLDPGSTGATTLDGRNNCSGGTPNPTTGCDTISQFINGVHTPSALTAPGGTGWLAGTNSYNDKAKAELFQASSFPANFQLTGFYIYFHAASGTGDVTFKVWNSSGAGGTPGTVLAQGNVPIANIPTNGNAILLDLSANPIPITGNFYIGFDIPTTAGTSISMYTTAANQPAANSGWEQWNNGSWNSYQTSYGGNYANAVFAIGCSTAANASPVANFTGTPTTLPAGNTVQFTQTSTNNPTSFAWSISPNTGIVYSGGTNATSANPTVQFNTPGQYTVTLTATNSSGSDSETKTAYITVTNPGGNVSLDELFSAGAASIYPNPANHALTVDLGLSLQHDLKIRIIDMIGKTIETTLIPEGVQSFTLPVNHLAQGVYHLELSGDSGKTTKKFIKN